MFSSELKRIWLHLLVGLQYWKNCISNTTSHLSNTYSFIALIYLYWYKTCLSPRKAISITSLTSCTWYLMSKTLTSRMRYEAVAPGKLPLMGDTAAPCFACSWSWTQQPVPETLWWVTSLGLHWGHNSGNSVKSQCRSLKKRFSWIV